MNRKEPILDGEYYHVYNRGNRKMPIFGDDTDYRSFLKKLRESALNYNVRVVVYTLMPNHFHFVLLQLPSGSIEHMMNSVETSAAKRFNLKYGKVGHLFQGRYRYIRIDSDESLLIVARYIHLNPVEARLVRRPEAWPYSDFADIVRMVDKDEGVLHPGSTADEGRLLPGYLLPCSPREYVAFVRVEGALHPGSTSEKGRLRLGSTSEKGRLRRGSSAEGRRPQGFPT